MKNYSNPSLDIINFSAKDIIQTSDTFQEDNILGDGADIMPSSWKDKLLGN